MIANASPIPATLPCDDTADPVLLAPDEAEDDDEESTLAAFPPTPLVTLVVCDADVRDEESAGVTVMTVVLLSLSSDDDGKADEGELEDEDAAETLAAPAFLLDLEDEEADWVLAVDETLEDKVFADELLPEELLLLLPPTS